MSRYRYGPWRGGDDPLQPPFDVGDAVDRLGEDVLSGRSVAEAMRDLMRSGPPGRRGLDDLRAAVRRRRHELRQGDLAGPLRAAQELLDSALAAERSTLGTDPSPQARDREATLDRLPASLPQAVRDLADYSWASPEAQEDYERIRSSLRDDVVRQQVRGAPSSAGEAGASAVKDLLAELNALLAAHARGQDTTEQFERFMARHGGAFPEQPRTTDELIDLLASRAAAAQRLLASLDPQQREALRDLMAQALQDDVDLAAQLTQLVDNLRALRPGADWSSSQRMGQGEPLGYVEATDTLDELARLDDLADQLGQQYPGASLDDIDSEALNDVLGPAAVEDVDALRRLERELADQGWVTGSRTQMSLSAKAVRRLGQTALRRVLDQVRTSRGGGHDQTRSGVSGDPDGGWRPWEFGDAQPFDPVRTVQQALLRGGSASGPPSGVRLAAGDFAVVETEARSSAAVALLVDLSFSMIAEGRWGPMKQTALALQHLVSSRFRQDALEIIGFDRWARPLDPIDLASVEPSYVPGTNLAQALSLAHRFVRGHPASQPVVVVVTDGEPTAHVDASGEAVFSYPPMAETVRRTVAEVDELARYGTALTIVMLGDDPGLDRFVRSLARRSGGRVLSPSTDRLGEYVVADYLRSRGAR